MHELHDLRVSIFRRCKSCPLWFTTKSNCDRHQVRKHGSAAAGEDGLDAPMCDELSDEDEERGLVHVENGSLVDEDEEVEPEDEEEEEEDVAVVNGVDSAQNNHSLKLTPMRKRSLMDTIAKLSGSAKKKQVCAPR